MPVPALLAGFGHRFFFKRYETEVIIYGEFAASP